MQPISFFYFVPFSNISIISLCAHIYLAKKTFVPKSHQTPGPGLDLLKARLQGSNLVLGVLQVVLEVILMPVKICKISTIYSEVRLSATQNNK
jgi:hypothetical protein